MPRPHRARPLADRLQRRRLRIPQDLEVDRAEVVGIEVDVAASQRLEDDRGVAQALSNLGAGMRRRRLRQHFRQDVGFGEALGADPQHVVRGIRPAAAKQPASTTSSRPMHLRAAAHGRDLSASRSPHRAPPAAPSARCDGSAPRLRSSSPRKNSRRGTALRGGRACALLSGVDISARYFLKKADQSRSLCACCAVLHRRHCRSQIGIPDVVEIARREFALRNAARRAADGADAQAFFRMARRSQSDDGNGQGRYPCGRQAARSPHRRASPHRRRSPHRATGSSVRLWCDQLDVPIRFDLAKRRLKTSATATFSPTDLR